MGCRPLPGAVTFRFVMIIIIVVVLVIKINIVIMIIMVIVIRIICLVIIFTILLIMVILMVILKSCIAQIELSKTLMTWRGGLTECIFTGISQFSNLIYFSTTFAKPGNFSLVGSQKLVDGDWGTSQTSWSGQIQSHTIRLFSIWPVFEMCQFQ